MTLDDFQIYIPHTYIQDPQTTSFDIVVFAALSLETHSMFKLDRVVTATGVAYAMYGEDGINKNIKKIDASIRKIISDGVLPGRKVKAETYLMEHISSYKDVWPHYTILPYMSINKIFCDARGDDSSLLKTYAYVMASRSLSKEDEVHGKRGIVAYFGSKWYAKQLSISPNTFSRHITRLEELEVLYVFRPKATSAGRNSNNIMGAYADKHLVDLYAYNKHLYNVGDQNQKRSYMQKYNRIVRAGSTAIYPVEEVMDIYEYIKERNQTEVVKSQEYNGRFEPDIKDLSVFERDGIPAMIDQNSASNPDFLFDDICTDQCSESDCGSTGDFVDSNYPNILSPNS